MLWLAGRCAGEPMSDLRRSLTLAACECARLTLPHVRSGEDRPLRAIELAERWARGEAVLRDELRDAAAAADAYADAYAAAYAAYAAYAAATAATAAYAAYAAATATAAATAADAASATYTAARKETLRKCADILRKHYPKPPEITP
jgi:hypothetical protein